MHVGYISLPWVSPFLHIDVNQTTIPKKRYNYYLHGPTSCTVCATHTRHIEIKLTPCTMSHLGVHQTKDPHGMERLYHTLYSLGGRVRTQTPTVLNHSKMYNSCWCRQFSNHRHTCNCCTAIHCQTHAPSHISIYMIHWLPSLLTSFNTDNKFISIPCVYSDKLIGHSCSLIPRLSTHTWEPANEAIARDESWHCDCAM